MPRYLDFYALRKAPFDVRPGRGPVLATRALREGLAWITEHVEGEHTLLCVHGIAGVGLSSLGRVLPGHLASHCRTARVSDVTREWSEIEVDLAEQLFLASSLSRDTLVGARSQGDRVVIIVDGAERASEELLVHLDDLMELRGPALEQLVQIVLLSRSPGPRQEPLWTWLGKRRGLVHELDRISPDEIHGYIRKRLQAAGADKSELFSRAASRVVHRHSEGIPERVNRVCDVVLDAAWKRSAVRVDAGLVDETMGTTGR